MSFSFVFLKIVIILAVFRGWRLYSYGQWSLSVAVPFFVSLCATSTSQGVPLSGNQIKIHYLCKIGCGLCRQVSLAVAALYQCIPHHPMPGIQFLASRGWQDVSLLCRLLVCIFSPIDMHHLPSTVRYTLSLGELDQKVIPIVDCLWSRNYGRITLITQTRWDGSTI